MPIWAYQMSPLLLALMMVTLIETVSLIGLFLTRRFILPHLHFHDGVNDAISGTVQAIGVFYGITVGLIAAGVWTTNSSASDLVSREASSIATLRMRDFASGGRAAKRVSDMTESQRLSAREAAKPHSHHKVSF